MNFQQYFNYQFIEKKDENNYFVNETNRDAFDVITDNNFDQNIFLFAPKKSGKSHLIKIWKEKNNALIFYKNFSKIIKSNNNVAVDDTLLSRSEEELFHIINHCKLFNLKIFLTSSVDLNNLNFKLKDLYSRLRSFYYLKINKPDDEMCKMYMTKLFLEKQIIINSTPTFHR